MTHHIFSEDHPLVQREQKKGERRKKKKTTRMKVSGKSVLKLQHIMRSGSRRKNGKPLFS